MKQSRFFGIYEDGFAKRRSFYTKSLAKGKNVYGERIYKDKGEEYRQWNPERSKLCAAIHKGCSQIGIKPGFVVLYLGAATGTTPSHVSDIVGEDGFVFALDFAPVVVRELYFLCQERRNMTAMLESASKPEEYKDRVCQVDTVYQDIAQRDQAEMFLKNCDMFLKKGGFGIICVKARSIDVVKQPRLLFKEVRKKLEDSNKMIVVDERELEPFEKDHCVFVCKKK